ncbi:bacteriophage abortive infection AbiH family protein [Glaciecola sp. MF2-115]|uniref:bacteriophage abortive infection AbiH family protein n=1 Tax=Glaciecola sp. MF2-115 TaxID=3384827 RepID=UPI0039A34521
MTTIVIIGNGFDIWHGLPTSYRNFYKQYSEALKDHTHYFPDFYDIDMEWANFEESLGSFDQDSFHENVTLQPSLEELGDDPKLLYGFEDEITIKKDELVEAITDAFKEWISKIDVQQATKLVSFPNTFRFINFNYTTTLQAIYGISEDSILHIHGRANRDIIFGHGRVFESSSSDEPEEIDEPWFTDSYNDVSSVNNVFYKPVNDIIERHSGQLLGYEDVTDVVIIGHSINDIDIPYFKSILAAYPDAKWKNYNYQDIDEGIDEVAETHERLLNAGVPEEKLISTSSEDLKNICQLRS